MKIILDRWCFTDLDVKITELSSPDVYSIIWDLDLNFDSVLNSIPNIIVNQIRSTI